MSNAQDTLTRNLDRLEEELPMIASKSVALSRATVRRTTGMACSVVDEIGERASAVGRSLGIASRTVTGQTRSASDRAVSSVRSAVAESTGQARAQAHAVADTVRTETADLLDNAIGAVDHSKRRPASLADLSKAELYERAQAADIDGRSAMSKNELITALRSR